MSDVAPFAPTHRVKCAPGFFGESSKFDGIMVECRKHESNKYVMARLEFPNEAHQKLWGGSWLYIDDLEEIR